MALGTALPFGLREVVLTPINPDGTEGTAVRLPHSRTFSFTEAEDFEELRGDDRLVAVRGSGSEVEWELESGGIDLDAYKVIAGGTVAESGTTPTQTKTFSKKGTDTRPYFKVEGRAISDSGGDVHCVVYRCRCTDSLEGTFEDGQFFLTEASGRGIPDPDTDALYDFVYNESETEIGTA